MGQKEVGTYDGLPDLLDMGDIDIGIDLSMSDVELLPQKINVDLRKDSVSAINKLIKYIQYQLSRDENVFILIDGRTQMGKSTMAIMIALALESYSLHNVQFGIEGFRGLINEKLPEHSVLIYDDPQTEFNAQDWQQKRVKTLTRIAQTMGSRHYVVIMTTPNIGSLPGQIQYLVTIYLQGDDYKKGLFYSKRPIRKKNVTMKNRDIYYGYLKVKISGIKGKVTLKTVETEKLPQDVYDAYDEKKNKFLDSFYEPPKEPEKPKKAYSIGSLRNLRPYRNKTDKELKEILDKLNRQRARDDNPSDN